MSGLIYGACMNKTLTFALLAGLLALLSACGGGGEPAPDASALDQSRRFHVPANLIVENNGTSPVMVLVRCQAVADFVGGITSRNEVWAWVDEFAALRVGDPFQADMRKTISTSGPQTVSIVVSREFSLPSGHSVNALLYIAASAFYGEIRFSDSSCTVRHL